MVSEFKARLFNQISEAIHCNHLSYGLVLAREMMDVCSDSIEGYVSCAEFLIDLSRYHEAEFVLDQAENLNSQKGLDTIWGQRGKIYFRLGKFDKSLKCYRRCIELAPQEFEYIFRLGVINARLGDLQKAEVCFRKASNCKEGCIDEAFLNLGHMLKAQEKFEESRLCYQSALEYDSQYNEAMLCLRDVECIIEYKRRKPSEGEKAIDLTKVEDAANQGCICCQLLIDKEIVRVTGEGGAYYAYVEMGQVLTQMARYEEAEEVLLKALRLCPEGDDETFAIAAMGDLFEVTGQIDRAIDWYKKSNKIKPQSAEGYCDLGELLFNQGRLVEAQEYLENAINCPEGRTFDTLLLLGYVLRSQEKFVLARDYFNECLKKKPGDKEVLTGLTDIELVMHKNKKTRN